MTDRVPSDVVKGIFHYISANSRFRADPPRIHETFYKLSLSGHFASLFKDFVFDISRPYPYCNTINFALDRLQKATLLSCINPKLDHFEISEELAADAEIEKLFSGEEIALLQEGAKVFYKTMTEA